MPLNENLFELASEQINLALREMLATDPANQAFIAKLDNTRIKIDCTQPAFSFFVEFQDGQIGLKKTEEQENHATEPDLQLSGTAINLLKLATSPIDNASGLRGSNVSVSGDVGLLLEISQVAKMIEIDWELLLANKIGETPAVIISRTISAGIREARNITASIADKATEKMQSEHSPLPTKTELGNLKSELRELNYRLDRLEATNTKNAASNKNKANS